MYLYNKGKEMYTIIVFILLGLAAPHLLLPCLIAYMIITLLLQ